MMAELQIDTVTIRRERQLKCSPPSVIPVGAPDSFMHPPSLLEEGRKSGRQRGDSIDTKDSEWGVWTNLWTTSLLRNYQFRPV